MCKVDLPASLSRLYKPRRVSGTPPTPAPGRSSYGQTPQAEPARPGGTGRGQDDNAQHMDTRNSSRRWRGRLGRWIGGEGHGAGPHQVASCAHLEDSTRPGGEPCALRPARGPGGSTGGRHAPHPRAPAGIGLPHSPSRTGAPKRHLMRSGRQRPAYRPRTSSRGSTLRGNQQQPQSKSPLRREPFSSQTTGREYTHVATSRKDPNPPGWARSISARGR